LKTLFFFDSIPPSTITMPKEQEEEDTFMGRRLFSAPTLWQDWGDDPQHGDAKYWELFTDLLLVAAASSIADTLRNDLSISGVIEFASIYMVICGGWLMYTHQYTSRFNDASLTHSLLLFIFLIGMAITIVNASYEHIRYFCIGLIIQRAAYLIMLRVLYMELHVRCGPMVIAVAWYILAQVAVYISMVAYPSIATWMMPALALLEVFGEWIFVVVEIPRSSIVPINIEHSKDRLGVLCLVMIGETIISITIEYREHMEEGVLSEQVEESYYALLALACLLVFMFTLLYFNMQPPPALHAFRRSTTLGWAVLALHKLMGLALLAVGVAIKVAVSTVVENEQLTPFASKLLGVAVGSSLLNLFVMRLCHFHGRPKFNACKMARLLIRVWMASFVVFSILPLCFMFMLDPVQVFLWQSVCMATLCVLETGITHLLESQITIDAFLGIKEESKTTEAHEGTALLK